MESTNSNIPEKRNKEILLDYLKESIGIENGLAKTLIDLKNKPKAVLDGYLQGDKHYVSPFKLLFGGLTVWLLVNSFIIDWYKIWDVAIVSYINFLDELVERNNGGGVDLDASMLAFKKVFVQFGGDLFTKIYVPFVIFVIPVSAYFAVRLTRRFNVSYRTLISVNCYVMGANVLVYLIMSITAAINFWVFLGICLVLVSLALMGYNFIMLVPPRRFFISDGLAIEKKMIVSNFYSVSIFMLVIGIG